MDLGCMQTCLIGILLLMMKPTSGFIPNNLFSSVLGGGGHTHSFITKQAVLRCVCRMFQKTPNYKGETLPPEACEGKELNADSLVNEYYGEGKSSVGLVDAMEEMATSNSLVDIFSFFDEEYHFDAEMFDEAKSRIVNGMKLTAENLKANDTETARSEFGKSMHTVQDFYSHSNWIELGYTMPNSGIILADVDIGNTAAPTQRTCINCDDTCENNIPDDIIKSKTITTGYFGFFPSLFFFYSDLKPEGKCSHGGSTDFGSSEEPTGGINKDTVNSSHGYLHYKAAETATMATLEALEQIKQEVGEKAMLRFFNLEAGGALSCVIDTREVTAGDLAMRQQRVISIVDSKQGTLNEPSSYILVTFNGTGIGPAFKTTEAGNFKKQISNLKAGSGGKDPGMCLSALELSLTSTPLYSSIYVITDAAAKDSEKKNDVNALIESMKSSVTFLMANPLARRRRALGSLGLRLPLPLLPTPPSPILLDPEYKDIASSSGGQVMFLPTHVPDAVTSLLSNQTQRAKVTILYARSSPSKFKYDFTFHLDPAMGEVNLAISGLIQDLTLIDPNGLLKSIPLVQRLGELLKDVGDLIQAGGILVLKFLQTLTGGKYKLQITSQNDFILNLNGISVVNFRYTFVESFDGPHPGVVGIDRPLQAGSAAVIKLSVTGLEMYNTYKLTKVSLIDSSGNELQGLTVNQGDVPGDYSAEVKSLPSQPFSLILEGLDTVTNQVFQRQSAILHRPSNVTVKGYRAVPLPAGGRADLPFTIQNIGQRSTYRIETEGSSIVESFSPSRVTLEMNETAEGTITVVIPMTNQKGMTYSIKIKAEAEEHQDCSFWIIRIVVK